MAAKCPVCSQEVDLRGGGSSSKSNDSERPEPGG